MTRYSVARKPWPATARTQRRPRASRWPRHYLRRLYRGLDAFLRGLWDGMGRYHGPRGL